jgi:hypothetical protein
VLSSLDASVIEASVTRSWPASFKIDGSLMRRLFYPMLALALMGADWPQFRGSNGTGLCPSCGELPTEFGPQKNVLWRTALPEGKSALA